jgi:hypothetical protein
MPRAGKRSRQILLAMFVVVRRKALAKRPGPKTKVIGAAATNRCQAAPVRVTEALWLPKLFDEFLGFSYQSAQLGSPLEGLLGVGPVLQSVLIVFGRSRSLAAMHTTSRFSGDGWGAACRTRARPRAAARTRQHRTGVPFVAAWHGALFFLIIFWLIIVRAWCGYGNRCQLGYLLPAPSTSDIADDLLATRLDIHLADRNLLPILTAMMVEGLDDLSHRQAALDSKP